MVKQCPYLYSPTTKLGKAETCQEPTRKGGRQPRNWARQAYLSSIQFQRWLTPILGPAKRRKLRNPKPPPKGTAV